MVRSTAWLLTVVMLLASGRLLACGWECIDELAAPAEASCHQKSAPAGPALEGGASHACLPEVLEAPVTVTQKAAAASVSPMALADVPATIRFGVAPKPGSSLHRPSPTPAWGARVSSILRI